MEWIMERIKDAKTTGAGLTASLVPLYTGVEKILKGDTLTGALEVASGLLALALGFLAKSK